MNKANVIVFRKIRRKQKATNYLTKCASTRANTKVIQTQTVKLTAKQNYWILLKKMWETFATNSTRHDDNENLQQMRVLCPSKLNSAVANAARASNRREFPKRISFLWTYHFIYMLAGNISLAFDCGRCAPFGKVNVEYVLKSHNEQCSLSTRACWLVYVNESDSELTAKLVVDKSL